MKKLAKIFIALLVVVLVVGAVIALTKLIKPDIDASSNAMLTHEGKAIPEALEGNSDSVYRVDVNAETFEIQIIPNDVVVFEFYHDDKLTTFPHVDGDWLRAFNVQIYDGYFTFDNANRSLLDIIGKALYPNEEMRTEHKVDSSIAYFTIVVKVGDESYSFGLEGWSRALVQILPGEVVF